jgi:hypothetical protein
MGLVFRRVALPVNAFDVLKRLQREWRLETNSETLTKILLTYQPNVDSEVQLKEEETAISLRS